MEFRYSNCTKNLMCYKWIPFQIYQPHSKFTGTKIHKFWEFQLIYNANQASQNVLPCKVNFFLYAYHRINITHFGKLNIKFFIVIQGVWHSHFKKIFLNFTAYSKYEWQKLIASAQAATILTCEECVFLCIVLNMCIYL